MMEEGLLLLLTAGSRSFLFLKKNPAATPLGFFVDARKIVLARFETAALEQALFAAQLHFSTKVLFGVVHVTG